MQVVLVMFKEDGESRTFPIDPGKTVIGRREDCDLRIPLSEISRKHALLVYQGSKLTLRDLGSANGTYINNKRITEQALEAGDHIVIGPVVFTVQIDGNPADVRPVRTRLEARQPALHEDELLAPHAKTAAAAGDDFDIDFGNEGEEDPISALEALAGSDETTQIDFNDSDFDLNDSKGP